MKLKNLKNHLLKKLNSKEAMIITKKFLLESLNNEAQLELLNSSIQEVENTLSTKGKFIQ